MSGPKFKIFVWRSTAMILFGGTESPMHEHATAQFSLGVGSDARVRERHGDWVSAPAVLVPQGIPHAYDARQGLHLVLWIEPGSRSGRAIRTRFSTEELHLLEAGELEYLRLAAADLLREGFGPREATALRDEIIEWLAGQLPGPSAPIDHRLLRALDVLDEHRDRELTVGELAVRAGMSESHLSHLFSEQIGVPVSRYRMWLRTFEAARCLHESRSVTEAAHAAGFSDAAHLSRTFKRLFGQSPGFAVRHLVEMHAIDGQW